jgi:stage II sporulation protein D
LCAPKGQLAVVIGLPLEEMTARVVAAESAGDAPFEYLAALAVVVRSRLSAARERSKSVAWDFVDSTSDALFFGEDLVSITQRDSPGDLLARCEAACVTTEGLVLSFNGVPQNGFFHAACGGRTLVANDIWPPDPRADGYDSVRCRVCAEDDSLAWKRTLEPDLLPLRLSEVKDGGGLALSAARRESVRILVGRESDYGSIPSNNYRLSRSGGKWFAEGRGSGHCVGLCQRGAVRMAEEGRSRREILRAYLPSCEMIPLP